jgi:hypothetical protein
MTSVILARLGLQSARRVVTVVRISPSLPAQRTRTWLFVLRDPALVVHRYDSRASPRWLPSLHLMVLPVPGRRMARSAETTSRRSWRFASTVACVLFAVPCCQSGDKGTWSTQPGSVALEHSSNPPAASVAASVLPPSSLAPPTAPTESSHPSPSGPGLVDAGLAVESSVPAKAPAGARCPPLPPKDGSPCNDPSLACTYVACPGAGETSVHCYRGKVVSEVVPCANFSCGGGVECSADKICVERSHGSHQTRCVPNPCGTKALTCDCAGNLCDGEACAIHGRIVRCGSGCAGCP